MKIILLSGFLGAGKTTFIQYLSKHLDDICILENDYAMADVDSTLLKNTSSDIFSLEDGCICCSKKADFATTVLTICAQLNPEFLIVEPTGLGYLSKVIDNLKTVEYENIELLAPITIVDYHNIDETLKNYRHLFIDQLRNAGIILLSKIENVSNNRILEAIEKIRDFTDAKIYTNHYSEFSEDEFKDLLIPYDMCVVSGGDHHVHMDTIVCEDVSFKDFQELGTALSAVCQNRFGKLVRAKGHVKVKGYDAKIDVVSGSFDIVPSEENSGKLVFVGEKLDKRAFEILFKRAVD